MNKAELNVLLTNKQWLMNLLVLRSVTASIKSQSLLITILITDVSLLQVIVQKLLDDFIWLDAHLNEQMKTVTEIQSYIAEVKNYIIVLKGKLSTVENYAAETQSTLMKMIDISGFIVEYLRKNGRTADAEVIKMVKDKWITLNVKNERILMKCKGRNEQRK